MWVDYLQDNYGTYDVWASCAATYGLAERLGPTKTIAELWEENPIIKGDVNPAVFGYATRKELKQYNAQRIS